MLVLVLLLLVVVVLLLLLIIIEMMVMLLLLSSCARECPDEPARRADAHDLLYYREDIDPHRLREGLRGDTPEIAPRARRDRHGSGYRCRLAWSADTIGRWSRSSAKTSSYPA